MKDWLREKAGLFIVIALMIAYGAYFSALSIQQHQTFRTHASDLGQMDQALWNTLRGNWLEDTRDNGDRTARQAPRLTDHVEPIFLPVSLTYLFFDGVEGILVLQSFVIALGALPIFWIARRKLKSDRIAIEDGAASWKDWAAIVLAAIYLLFPALEAGNLAEFHADTFAPAPLLFAFNYAEERAWKRFALFALVAMAVKEDIPLLVMVMAGWAAVSGQQARFAVGKSGSKQQAASSKRMVERGFEVRVGRRKFWVAAVPAAIAVISLIWFLVALFVIVPRFAPAGRSVYLGRYTCASQALKDPLTAIPQLVGCVLIPEKILYVIELAASAGLVALLDPVILLIGSPALAFNLLSSYEAQYSGTYHYSALVAPYFVLAAIGGVQRLRGWLSRRMTQGRALAVATLPALVVALGYHTLAGYTPIGGESFWYTATPHQELLARFLKQIPAQVPVSTTSTLFPHLSHRRFLYRFPTIQDADHILLDVSQSNTKVPLDFRLDYLDALKQGFGVRDALDGYILLQRGLAQQELPDGFYNFLRTCSCTPPEHRVTVDFEGKLRLLGYDVRQDDWQRVYLRTYWTRLPGFDQQNYALFPFYADENGALRADARNPDLLVHFWYPTARWQEGEVIVAETTPLEVGERTSIGVGVFFGATWEDSERRLAPSGDTPLTLDRSAALVGELVKDGKGYRVVGVTGR